LAQVVDLGSLIQAENRAYGHAYTLSRYAGFTKTRWVPGALQHGWNRFDGIGIDDGVWRPLRKFVWTDENVSRGVIMGGRNYVAIGAPWLYLLRQRGLDSRPRQGDRRSTIAYPVHRTLHTDLIGSHERYAKDLAATEKGRSVTVCLHWMDFEQRETVRLYRQHGFRVVTNGRGSTGAPGHDTFLDRQLGELLHHGRVVSNELATAILYAASLGRAIGIYGEEMSLAGHGLYYESDVPRRWPELHQESVDLEAADSAWRSQLGRDRILSAAQLKDVMGWNGRSAWIWMRFMAQRSVDLVRLNLPGRSEPGRRWHFRAY
jgi:hypothetical protein